MNENLLKDLLRAQLGVMEAIARMIPGDIGRSVRNAGLDIVRAVQAAATDYLETNRLNEKTPDAGGTGGLKKVDID